MVYPFFNASVLICLLKLPEPVKYRIAAALLSYGINLISILLPNLLELLKSNKHRELPQNIFEVGQIIKQDTNKTSLAWIELASRATFSKARSTAENIVHRLQIEAESTDEEDPIFISGRSVHLKNDNITIKYGEIHPRTLEKFSLNYPAIAGEIHW